MPRPALQNPPLVQVVFEIRFHGDLNVYYSWGNFQDHVRERYPRMYVPGAVEGQSPLLQPIHLTNEEGTRAVLLAVNSFAYLTRRYEGFERFKQELEQLVAGFNEHHELRGITRLGLRYSNLLPPVFPAQRRPGQLHPCVKLTVAGPGRLPTEFSEQPVVTMVGPVKDGLSLRTSLGSPETLPVIQGAAVPAGVPGVILDFDCFSAGPPQLGDIPNFIEIAHSVIEDAFFDMITPDYERFLRGESH